VIMAVGPPRDAVGAAAAASLSSPRAEMYAGSPAVDVVPARRRHSESRPLPPVMMSSPGVSEKRLGAAAAVLKTPDDVVARATVGGVVALRCGMFDAGTAFDRIVTVSPLKTTSCRCRW